ncbi:unnamed protein product [Tilletia controversa]|nr:unnamed protein product [Tilletia controversa]CAD6909223.1 unnamed protein product [Tilletia controversa]
MTAISSPSSTHDIVKRAIMDDIDRVFLLADDLGCFTGLAASNSARRFSTSTFFHLGIDFGTGDQVHLFGGPSPYPHIYFFFQQQLAHIRTTRLHCALLHGIRHSHARSSAHCFSHVLTPRLRCFVRYTCGSTTAPATLQTHFGTDFGTAACDSIPEGHFHSGIDIGTGDRHPLIYLFDLPQLAHIFNRPSVAQKPGCGRHRRHMSPTHAASTTRPGTHLSVAFDISRITITSRSCSGLSRHIDIFFELRLVVKHNRTCITSKCVLLPAGSLGDSQTCVFCCSDALWCPSLEFASATACPCHQSFDKHAS